MILLDKHSTTPNYLQVSDALEKMMKSGHFNHGDKLPTLTEMRSILNISLKVIAQAYDELSKKGYIYSRRGKGYFVSYHKKIQVHLNDIYHIENKLVYEMNMKKTIVLYETIKADAFIKEKLELDDDQECYHIKEYYGDDKKNVMIQDVYYPKSLFPRVLENTQKYITIPPLLSNGYGYHIKRSHNKYFATHSTIENHLFMKLSVSEPLWRIDSICYDKKNKAICLIKYQLSGEYVTMSVMIDAN